MGVCLTNIIYAYDLKMCWRQYQIFLFSSDTVNLVTLEISMTTSTEKLIQPELLIGWLLDTEMESLDDL